MRTCIQTFLLFWIVTTALAKRVPTRPRKISRGRAADKCVYIPGIPNGYVVYENPRKLNHINKKIFFYCDEGYKLTGVKETICQADTRTWLDAPPTCIPWRCSDLVGVQNGKILQYNTLPPSEVKFECDVGFRMVGASTIKCSPDTAEWDNPQPQCVLDRCPPITTFRNGQVMNYDNKRGSEIIIMCNPAFELQGPSKLTCSGPGPNWDSPVPKCVCKDPIACVGMTGPKCPSVVSIPNGYFELYSGDGVSPRSRVKFYCNAGWELETSIKSIVCEKDGEWDRPIPTCRDVHCPKVDVITNGKVLDSSNNYNGKRIKIQCDDQYYRDGPFMPKCNDDGQWSELPVCTKPECPDILTFPHGYIRNYSNINPIYGGSRLFYNCDYGFKLVGKSGGNNKCLYNGVWEKPDIPQCVFGYAVCVAHGDPHYSTFDKQKITFMGTCKYTLASTCGKAAAHGLEEFNVEGKNFAPAENKRVSYTKYLTVDVYGYRIKLGPGIQVVVGRLVKNKGESYMVNGVQMNLPVTNLDGAAGLTIKLSGRFIELRTIYGLVVRLDEYFKADITVPSEYVDIDLCGVCGNFNMDPSDDILTKDGSSISYMGKTKQGKEVMKYKWYELGASWEVPGRESEEGCLSNENPEPNCEEEKLKKVQEVCGMMIDKNSVFGECLSHLGISAAEEDYHSCTYDACLLPNPTETMCDSLADFADKCGDQGFYVQWRTETFCPLQCRDSHSVYKPKTSACPKTCGDLDEGPKSCPEDDVEGCECIENYVLNSDGHCIHKSQCGCTNDKGFYYPVGGSYPADDCSATFICQADGTFRRDAQAPCHADAVCVNKGGLLGCNCKEGYVGDGINECKPDIQPSTCVAAGDPYFLTYDQMKLQFHGKCEYVLSEVCGSKEWSVYVQHKKTETSDRTYAHRVRVLVYQHDITLNEFGKIMIDSVDQTQQLPLTLSSVALEISKGTGDEENAIIVHAPEYGLKVHYDGRGRQGRHVLRVTVSKPDNVGKLCGICGNWNGDIVDDMIPHNGNEVASAEVVGNSWKTETPCPPGGIP